MADRCTLAGLRGALQTPSQGLSRITRRRPFFGGTVTTAFEPAIYSNTAAEVEA